MSYLSQTLFSIAVASVLLTSVPQMALAQSQKDVQVAAAPVPRLPVELFARFEKISNPTFSPDGKKLAVLAPYKERMNVNVIDIASGKSRFVSTLELMDVYQLRWISNERIVFSLVDKTDGLAEYWRGGGLFAVNSDGSDGRKLDETGDECMRTYNVTCRYTAFHSRILGSQEDILVVSNGRNVRSEDVYRLNTVTGRKTLLSQDRPGEVRHWVVDRQLRPRAAVTSIYGSLRSEFWYRDAGDDTAWRKVASYDDEKDVITPLGFDGEGTLYVASNIGEERAAIYKFDPAKNAPGEKLMAHPRYDLFDARLMFNSDKNYQLEGAVINSDKAEVVWFAPEMQRIQKGMDAALPGAVNQIRELDGGLYEVVSYSDKDPGTYYLLDAKKGGLQQVARMRPSIKPEQMAEMRPIRYKARDGLEIQAYVTLPAGRQPKGLPLVVWVHGGPFVRGDTWDWDRETQFLANRGYAVLQVNYRGSTGQGWRYAQAGYKQWGGKMQDDLNDGAKYLVSQGIVDEKRMCIGGGSYGGYATAMGLVRDPDLWKCGINYVGVTDLFWFEEIGYSDFNRADPKSSTLFARRQIGDPNIDRDMMEANSPRRHADRVKAPMLIIEGGGDQRVPIRHAEAMRDALKAAGKSVEWVEYREEAHGIVKPANVADYLTRMEEFLDRNIGDKAH